MTQQDDSDLDESWTFESDDSMTSIDDEMEEIERIKAKQLHDKEMSQLVITSETKQSSRQPSVVKPKGLSISIGRLDTFTSKTQNNYFDIESELNDEYSDVDSIDYSDDEVVAKILDDYEQIKT